MAQSGNGRIRLFNDFYGLQNALLSFTTDPISSIAYPMGDFYGGGEGIEDNDAGFVPSATAPLSGAITINSADTDADTAFIGTQIGLDVGLMGTITLETRIQIPDFDTKELFFGLTSILTVDEQLEDIVINASSTTVTMPADLVGFYFSDELSDDEAWHGIHSGGTTGASTTTTSVCLGGTGDATSVGPDVNDWQILRLEVDVNGNTSWYVDGVLRQTVAGACSTSTNFAVCLAAAANTTQMAIMECDYIEVTANRDWTV
jgi:hypothetical protein